LTFQQRKSELAPEISHLDVQLSHLRGDLAAGSRGTIESKCRTLGLGNNVSSDDEVWLPLRAFEFDLNMPILGVIFNE